MLHGVIVIVLLPLLAAPVALALWLLPSPADWLGVLVGLATGCLYAWVLGRASVRQLALHGPELLDRMRARPTRPAPDPVGQDGSPARPSVFASGVTAFLVTLGVILLVPQGLVALAFLLVGTGVRAWFVAQVDNRQTSGVVANRASSDNPDRSVEPPPRRG
jgi:hypothetical protein